MVGVNLFGRVRDAIFSRVAEKEEIENEGKT